MSVDLLLRKFGQLLHTPDAVAQFRSFALSIAVHGKLTSQNSDDGSASELLVELAAARQGVKGKRDERFPQLGFDRAASGSFGLPNTWAWTRLSDVAEFSAGRTPSRNDPNLWDTGDYHWVSIADMVDGGDLTTTKETISVTAKEQVFKCDPASTGTMLMSFKLTIGKITKLTIPAYHNEAIVSIAPYIPELAPYLFKILPQQARQGATKAAIKGATLNRNSLANILIPLPPLGEQRRIVSELDDLMELCKNLEATQKERESRRGLLRAAALEQMTRPDQTVSSYEQFGFLLDQVPRFITLPIHVTAVRQTILDLALRGRFTGHGEIDASGKDSKDTTLGEVVTGLHYGTSSKCSYEPTPYPVLRIPNVVDGRVSLSDMKYGQLSSREADSLRLIEGDILIVRSNGSLSLVGRPALVDAGAIGTYYAGYLVRARPNLQSVIPQYLVFALQSPSVRQQIEGPIRTTVGLKNINATELRRLHFRLPTIDEQGVIVTRVNELMTICDELEDALSRVQFERARLLDALLHEALDGLAGTVTSGEALN